MKAGGQYLHLLTIDLPDGKISRMMKRKVNMSQGILIVDYGSQYTQLIARRVRELKVYSEILPWNAPEENFERFHPCGIILSGGPASVYEKDAPSLPPFVLKSKVPVLGICYGMQLLAHTLGGRVARTNKREYGPAEVEITDHSALFKSMPERIKVWMSHGDRIERVPKGFTQAARSDNSPYAAMADHDRSIFGLQFHPEVAHTPLGKEILRNFLFEVCECNGNWTPESFIEKTTKEISEKVKGEKVICGLSGGVDSSVTAALVHRAIGERLIAVFVDHGLLRAGEKEEVVRTFEQSLGIELKVKDASAAFLSDLKGVTDPEEKRKRIGRRFVRVFEEVANELQNSRGRIKFLAQGTLYPDVIESAGTSTKTARTIKTHHNVGGLPEEMDFELLEPLRLLFKDEVRQVGKALGLPDRIIWRHPFPGPGLAIRILGEVTPQRLETLRQADAIFLEELEKAGLYRSVAQAFAVLLPVKSVGVMGDGRTYAHVIALRAVTSEDFMTADWARLPYELMEKVSSRIVNEVPGVNRVVYDTTSKPPGTIEWE